jgi:23S rRNA U2552 (ribose-2'-O)-methylase RlmE/FtsJ
MLFFSLPRLPCLKYKNIEVEFAEGATVPIISNSLAHYLGEVKKRIDHIPDEWDTYKKYTNPYEFIHTAIPAKKRPVAKHKPLSRSYFKMVEIVSFFKLTDLVEEPIRSFHLAEGPGGFIEALAYMRNNPSDRYVGMTILSDDADQDVPAWKKSTQFLKMNENVFIEEGCDGTGNILSISNFDHCIAKYGSTMDIITGDGGFNFSVDFNNQESNMEVLLFGQIVYALCMQKRGGSFVLKVFDCFMKPTVDMLALLSSFYKTVYITKPQSSRYANSEKYVVCKDFLYDYSDDFRPMLRATFDAILDNDEATEFHLFRHNPLIFTSKLEEYNAIFGQQQIENINYTLSLIEKKNKAEKIEHLNRQNIQKCVQWCIKYNVPYNKLMTATVNTFTQPTNIFRQSSGPLAPRGTLSSPAFQF